LYLGAFVKAKKKPNWLEQHDGASCPPGGFENFKSSSCDAGQLQVFASFSKFIFTAAA
jgi:hypothetical protein